MKRNEKSFFEFIKGCDLFGVNETFRIGDSDKHRSIFGGIVFLIFITLSFIYALLNFINFIKRENLTVYTSYQTKIPAPAVNITGYFRSYNSLFSNVAQTTFYSGNDLEYLELYFNYWTANNELINYTTLNTRQCTADDLPKELFTEAYSLILNKTMCLELEKYPNLLIYGSPTDANRAWISVDLLYNISATQYELTQLFEKRLSIILNMIQSGIDATNHTNPLPLVFNTNLMGISLPYYSWTNIELSEQIFYNDENVIFRNPIPSSSLVIDSVSGGTVYIENRNSNFVFKPNVLNSFNLYASNRVISINRTYQKITEYLANMSGLISNIWIILFFIFPKYNEICSNTLIINKIIKYSGNEEIDVSYLQKLYLNNKNKFKILSTQEENNKIEKVNAVIISDFPQNNKSQEINEDYIINEFHMNNKHKQSVQIEINSKENNNDNNNNINNNSNYKKVYLDTVDDYNTEDNQKLDIKKIEPLFLFLKKCFLCKSKNLKIQKEIIDKGRDNINHYLDVLTYLKAMQEVEVIKELILDEKYRKMFNFIRKPEINNYQNTFNQEIPNLQKEEIQKIFNDYEFLLQKKTQTELDLKIIHLFKEDLNAICNIENIKNF